MGNTPCRVCRRTAEPTKFHTTPTASAANMASSRPLFSLHNSAGVYWLIQSTSLPINWNISASKMPEPMVRMVSTNNQPRVPCRHDQINGSRPLRGAVGAVSG